MSRDIFEVVGGKSLKGTIAPQGAKNEALQILSAVLLSEEDVTVSNIPDILDVNVLIELLAEMGVRVSKQNADTYTFNAKDVNPAILLTDNFKKRAGHLRGSVMILGPLLARFRKAYLPTPGGDKIGRRRLDTHFLGFVELGAKYHYDKENSFYSLTAEHLVGKYILLEEPSVTGTANIIMAAVLAEGETTIFNAACEPYLQQLCSMLNRMGAKIAGIGSNLLKIEGVKKLGGTTHRLLPDMIEIGSFIGLAAMTKSDIIIKDARVDMLGIIPAYFKKLGIQLDLIGDDIHIPAQDKYVIKTFIDGSILTISDGPWPLFTPDLLSIMLVTATQADGSVLIHQKMFESRLFFVDKLIDMGAKIILCDPHRATVIGINREYNLRGIEMSSPDIRAGVALLIAALSAEGKSVISNIHQIDRGYQYIDKRLQNLGADITRL
ncbi:MAG TPA: UDP-N-acetylglucosamine 1-carboxyvinyltransferase [Chitinophagales bacterium]|nr:UDP-N-acetylglucosamine 1-carboxyvinyltransferase [Chitinophagales bacterium]HNM31251.1 UDP-N-acetylglucosamine 1-carboxyvinyltransferase [Chitinophagales bacterium]